jgi:hypothetical protein
MTRGAEMPVAAFSLGLDRITPSILLDALRGERSAHVCELGTEFRRDMPQGTCG